MMTLEQVEMEVRKKVEAVRDCPAGRMRLREAFYGTYGEVRGWPDGFGTSELEFLGWELRRGVLDPRTGSPWWRDVNLDFLYYSELAGRLQELGMDQVGRPCPVKFWIQYFHQPSALSWYRAHNASIVQGYLKYRDLALKESASEQTLLNWVLHRLLFAQSLTEKRHSISAVLAHIIANPLSPSVDILVHISSFYPDHYPLTDKEIDDLLHTSFTKGLAPWVLDKFVIGPRLTRLYREAAKWLRQPALETFVKRDRPLYPNH